MSETRLAKSKPAPQISNRAVETNPVEVAASAEYLSAPPKPMIIEVHPVEVEHSAEPQKPPDEKWSAIKAGIYTAGGCIMVAILVFGTQGRTTRLNADLRKRVFRISLS